MKNKNFEKLIYRAATTMPFSAFISTHVLTDAKLQEYLVELGTGKLIILVVGDPGAGKTSSLRVVLRNAKEVKFTAGLKVVKKIVQEMCDNFSEDGMHLETLFLDNFPNALSSYKLEAGRRILDYVVDILSEDGKSPQIIITGEPQALEELKKKEYLIGRTIPIWMPKLDANSDLYRMRKGFMEYKEEFDALLGAYHEWVGKNPVEKKSIGEDLDRYRKNNFGKYTSRRIGLVFCYIYALFRFSDFLEDYYGEHLDHSAIFENGDSMLAWENTIRKLSDKASVSYEVSVWNEFVKCEGTLKTYLPRKARCALICKSECVENDPYRYHCQTCGGGDCSFYNPMDLRMPSDSSCGILVEDVRQIPRFPKHIVCGAPVLMIQVQALVEMLNTFLESYSRKQGVNMVRVSKKRLSKQLFLHNLCLFEYVGDAHNSYTFRMKDTGNQDRRILFIKLTDAQFQKLKKESKPVRASMNYHPDAVISFLYNTKCKGLD